MVESHRARRLQAAESAGRLLAEAGVDQTRQVDVFGLCEQFGLWLAFFPLDGLLGAYLPEGSGGALITTQRPVSVQRYTAAHELGHWRLDHGSGPALDSEQQVLGDTADESEQLAQIFAAALLMPPPLVYGTLERLGVDSEVSSVHAYTVAREAGVSYEAAVRQLANLEIISRFTAGELLKTKPLKVKAEIGQGQRPIVGTADVWTVDEQWHGQRLRIHTDDQVVISLPENRSTGYRWFFEGRAPSKVPTPEPQTPQHTVPSGQVGLIEGLDDLVARLRADEGHQRARVPGAALDRARAASPAPSKKALEIDGWMTLVGDRYLTARAPEMSGRDAQRARLARLSETASGTESSSLGAAARLEVGGTGRRVLSVRFHRPGPATLRLKHQSAYSADAHPIDGYALDVDVEPRRRGLSIEQLVAAHDADWADDVRRRQNEYTSSDLEPQGSVPKF